MSRSNWAGSRACGPSESACSGQECTSTWMPSAPAATAARAIAGINSGRPVAWLGIDDDRQMALPLDVGHDRQIERVPGRILEGPNAALAKNHLAIPLRECILSRHEQILDGRAHSTLEQDGNPRAAALLQEVEVLHIASADLKNVGVTLDHFDLAHVHDLGDHGHPEALAGGLEHFEPVATEPLEAIGAGPRLESPAAQDVGPGLALTWPAISRSRGSLSMAHGPAITAKLPPPIRTPLTSKVEPSG